MFGISLNNRTRTFTCDTTSTETTNASITAKGQGELNYTYVQSKGDKFRTDNCLLGYNHCWRTADTLSGTGGRRNPPAEDVAAVTVGSAGRREGLGS